MEQFELGIHYYNLPTGDRGANLQRSIRCFTEALRFHTAEADPVLSATLSAHGSAAFDAGVPARG